MTQTTTTAGRLRLLARMGPAKRVDPITAPLAFALSAQVESWPLDAYLTDPTKLVKGLAGLNQALDTDVIWTACAGGIEIEALGAELDWSTYPPTVVPSSAAGKTVPPAADTTLVASPRIAASIETTRRLVATTGGQPAVCAALTGVGTLAAQLGVAGLSASDEPAGDHAAAGRLVLNLMKAFLEAGADGVALVERAMPAPGSPDFEAWKRALTPLNNTAGFFKTLLVCVLDVDAGADLTVLPSWLKACVPPGVECNANNRIGDALAPDFRATSAGGPLVTTAGEVPPNRTVGEVRQALMTRANG